jgi:hypothetical protein
MVDPISLITQPQDKTYYKNPASQKDRTKYLVFMNNVHYDCHGGLQKFLTTIKITMLLGM